MKLHQSFPWLGRLFAAAILITGFSIDARATYVTTTLVPSKIIASKGSVGAQPMSVLATQDLSGSVTDLTKAQRYTPGTTGFQGIFYFPVPAGTDLASASGISLAANFYGQPSNISKWTFQVRDQSANTWVVLGTNAGATFHNWTQLNWSLTGDLNRYLNSAGFVWIRYDCYSVTDTSDLDMLTLAVTNYTIDPVPPTAGVRTAFKGSISSAPDQVNFVANVADMQILVAVGDSKISSVHAANPADTIYGYEKIGGIHGPDTVAPSGDPGWPQVAAQNLLWYGPSGKPVTMPHAGWYWVDIITPSKRAAWTSILIANVQAQIARGYDGVFLDNSGIIDPSLITEFPANYSDAAYYQAVGQVLASVRAAIPGKKIILNSYTGGAAVGNRGLELLANADGLFFEDFAWKDSGKFFDPTRYLQVLDDYASVVASGKMAVGMDYAVSTDVQRRMFSIVTYLLVNSPYSYHFFAGTDVASDLQSYPEDSLDIGAALGEAVSRSDGLVTRAYASGTALVNTSTKSIAYSMGSGAFQSLVLSGGGALPVSGSATWIGMSGTIVTLAPNTAVVIRAAQ